MKDYLGFIVVALIAFLAIALISRHIYDYLPKSEDEAAYLFQAQVFAQNRVTVPTPPLADAFWSPFVIDHEGRRFGKYPPGWPLLLSGGVRLGLPWLVNGGLALLTLALLYRLGDDLYRPPTPSSIPPGGGEVSAPPPSRGRLGGGGGTVHSEKTVTYLPSNLIGLGAMTLAVITPGFLFLSSSLLSHAAALFWVTLALLALHRSTTAARPVPYALLTGVALGAAFLTRPFATLGIGLVIGLFLIILIGRRELPWSLLVWLILGGLPLAALLPLFWWLTTGDPLLNPYRFVWPYDRLGFGPDIGPLGYTIQDALWINTRLKLQALATGLFGWPGWSSLLFLPLPFVTRRATRWDWLLLGTLLSQIILHNFYWAFGGVDGGFPRYYYETLPALLLLTARGIAISSSLLRRLPFGEAASPRRRRLAYLPLLLVLGFTMYSFIWRVPPLLLARQEQYGITAQPLRTVAEAEITPPALILVGGVDSWSDFVAPFAANQPLLDGPLVYAIDWGPSWRKHLRALFKERACWRLEGDRLRPCFLRARP